MSPLKSLCHLFLHFLIYFQEYSKCKQLHVTICLHIYTFHSLTYILTHKPIYSVLDMRVCSVTRLYPTLCNSMDGSLPGSSVQGSFHTRILESVAIFPSRRPYWPRDQTCVFCISCIVNRDSLCTHKYTQTYVHTQICNLSFLLILH